MRQIEMVGIEYLVPLNHRYRRVVQIWCFNKVEKQLTKLDKDNPHEGYGIRRLFKCILLQQRTKVCIIFVPLGVVYADKGHCDKYSTKVAVKNRVYLRSIKKNNMRDKNKDLITWISQIRSPYERVFSQQRRQFSGFMETICFNLKKLEVLYPPNLCLD